MPRLLILAAAVLCLAAGPSHSWRVVGVTDGDTITCLTPEKQQVKGIVVVEVARPVLVPNAERFAKECPS